MKKNNLLNLMLLTPLPLTVAICSCEIKEQKEVSLLLPYLDNDKDQKFNTFKQIVDKFNNSELSYKYKENKIILKNFANPREINSKLALQLNINDKQIPSIIISYPSIVPLIDKYNKLMDLTGVSNSTSIPTHILNYNERLGTKIKNKIYSLPLGLSSEILIINKKILANYLFSLYEFSIKNDISNKNILNIRNSNYLSKIINEYDFKDYEIIHDFNIESVKNWDLLIDESIFETHEKLEKFSFLITKSLLLKKFDILFIKHVENFIYQRIFKMRNSSFSNYFLKYDQNNKLNYNAIFENYTNENKLFKESLIDFYRNLKSESFKIEEYNKKTSIEQINKQLFTIITSRIYEFSENFFKNNKKNLIIKSVPFKYKNTDSKKSYFLQGQFLSAIKSTIPNKNIVISKFLFWLYNDKKNYDWKMNNKDIKATPIEFLNLNLGYVYPTINFISKYKKYKNNNNKANNIVLDNIINKELIAFSDLVDLKSSDFRNNFKLSISSSLYQSAKKNENEEEAIKKFLELLLRLSK